MEAPESQVDLQAPRRNPWGWLLLLVLFSLVGGLQLSSYLKRPGKQSEQDNAIRALEREIKLDLMAKQYSDKSTKLDTALEKLKSSRLDSPDAAELYAVMAFQNRQPVEPATLSLLAKSANPAQRTLAKVYRADRLTPNEGSRVLREIPLTGFRYKLARKHVLFKMGRMKALGAGIDKADAIKALLLGVGGFFLFAVSLALWAAYFALRSSGKLEPLGHPALPASPIEADNLALKSGQLFLAFVVVSELVASLRAGSGAISWQLGLLMAALMIAGTFFCLRIAPTMTAESLGIHGRDFWKHVGWGVAGAIANVPLILMAAFVGTSVFKGLPAAQHPVETMIAEGVSPILFLSLVVQASIQAPIYEETLFRGTLLPAMGALGKKPWIAIAGSSILFAVIHPTGIPAWPALAAIGATSACLAYQTKSLVPSMAMHAVHNGATLVLALMLSG